MKLWNIITKRIYDALFSFLEIEETLNDWKREIEKEYQSDIADLQHDIRMLESETSNLRSELEDVRSNIESLEREVS